MFEEASARPTDMYRATGIYSFMPVGHNFFLSRGLLFEFEKLKKDLKIARDNYTSLVEEYSLLTGVVGKNLETEYMLKIGKKEHELFACKVEILRLKREISLFQSAINRGENINPEKVNEIINL